MHDPMGMPNELVARSRLEYGLDQAAKAVAILGGAIFIGLIAMSLVAIVGRKLNLLVVLGDIEIMQAGTAVAVACFMPYCTLLGEHLKVEFFTEKLPRLKQMRLDGMGDALLAVAMALITWRTAYQALDMMDSGEVTALLSIPMWALVAAVVPPLAFTVLCALFRASSALLKPVRSANAIKKEAQA